MTEEIKCWSADGEDFSFDSLDDLLSSHRDLMLGSVVYFGDQIQPAQSKLISASDVIEQIRERAYDLAGEHSDGYPSCTKEQEVELQALLEQWLAKCPPPNFYGVKNVQPYTLKDEDTQ